MTIQEYISARINASLKDGVIHVAKEFNDRYESLNGITRDLTIEDMEQWLGEIKRKEAEAESFSMDHLYYWSLVTHVEDIIKHAKLLETV